MAGTLTVDTIQSDSSYASTLNVASKMNFAAGMQIGGQDTTFGGMRNRIINGDMRIDQRNAGAAITQTVTQNYTVDRWWVYGDVTSKFTLQRNAGSVTPPSGFTNYYGITVASAYTPTTGQNFNLTQYIEGNNVADLDFGKATAKTITASFWIRSSLTGTFGGTLGNGLGSRSYVFSFTINSANTWEYKTITIPGDTSGTWNTDNSVGMSFTIALGNHSGYLNTPNSAWVAGDYRGPTSQVNLVSNAGATMYVTGVQLEKGSAASAFENRMYGQELALCQRYYEKSYDQATVPGTSTSTGMLINRGTAQAGGTFGGNIPFKVEKRAASTVTLYTSAGASGSWQYAISGTSSTVGMTAVDIASSGCRLNSSSNITAFQACETNGHFVASAEL